MKKPSLIKNFITIGITSALFFLWLVWTYVIKTNGDLPVEFFYYLVPFVIAEAWYMITTVLDYQKNLATFTQNMKLMGKREKLIDYEIKEITTNGGSMYYLEGSVHINDKDHKIRKSIPAVVGKALKLSKPVLDLYVDPTSTSKLTYHLDIEKFIK